MSAKSTAKSTSKPTGTRRRDALLVGGVFLLALVARLVYIYQSRDNPSFGTPIVDAGDYDLVARRLLEERVLDIRLFWQPFFYPWFLAAVYGLSAGVFGLSAGVFGLSPGSIVAAKLAQAVLGSLTCVMVFFLGRRLYGRTAGWLAAAATALYGPLIFFESELLATGWAAFWSVALVLLVLRATDKSRSLEAFGLGAVAALAVLTRPSFLPFVVAVWLWLVGRSLRAGGRTTSLVTLAVAPVVGFALLVVPVAAITYSETGRAGFLPASGGLNAYIGNNPETCETLAIRPGQDWLDLVSMPERHGATGLEAANRFFVSRVRAFVVEEPVEFVHGLASKALRFVNSREMPRNVDIYLASQWSSWLRALVWKLGSFGFPFGLLLSLAAVGLWRRLPPPPVWLFLTLYPAAIVLVFVSGRYRVPIVPILAVPAAAGVLALFEDVSRRRWKLIAVSGAVLITAALVVSLPGPFCEERLDLEADFYYCLAHSQTERQDLTGAISSYRESLTADPEQGAVHYNLALLLSGQGDLDGAASHYTKALRLDPLDARACNNLGSVLEKQGRREAALDRFAEAVRLDPRLGAAQRNLARGLLAAGRASEALEPIQRAIAIEPRPAEDHFLLGSVALQTGDTTSAVRELTESLRLAPSAKAHNDLGVAYLGRRNHEQALSQFQAAIQLEPGFLDSYGNAGVTLTFLGRYEDAKTYLEEAVKRRPRHIDSLLNLAVVLSRLGERQAAVEKLQEILELDPKQLRARALLDRLTAVG